MDFERDIIEQIDKVFADAWEGGRNTLYEHEVYEILKNIGIAVPQYIFVRNYESINEKLLRQFRHEVMIKVVSPDIAHKQKVGGVKIARRVEPLFLQRALRRMERNILSLFSHEEKPRIDGFLLVEFIEYSQAIGNEFMIGCEEDLSFGPVVAVSKGGSDAAFFAKYYDSANVFLPPLNQKQSLTLANSLKIVNKFKEGGHPEYITFMAEAISAYSKLAHHYSIASKNKPKYFIKKMEINPLVITDNRRFIALDGYAEFAPANKGQQLTFSVCDSYLEHFFRPKNIAIIDVSTSPDDSDVGRVITKRMQWS
ncbi:MAG TPA: hypothetical protein GXZ55_01825 [Natronincola sp.]|nr:hypothetical protein [Natronincola sp.]